MVNAAPLGHINLIFALLARMLALFGLRPNPPAPVVRALIRAETRLAADIRATLRADGVAFPDLPDPAFLVWFKQTFPGADQISRSGEREGGGFASWEWPVAQATSPPRPHMDRRLPAGLGFAGWKPAVHDARAPP